MVSHRLYHNSFAVFLSIAFCLWVFGCHISTLNFIVACFLFLVSKILEFSQIDDKSKLVVLCVLWCSASFSLLDWNADWQTWPLVSIVPIAVVTVLLCLTQAM
jgi:hypothetical protein